MTALLDEEYPDAAPNTQVEFEGKHYELYSAPLEKSLSGKTVKRMGHEWKEVEKKKFVVETLKRELKELFGYDVFVFDEGVMSKDVQKFLDGADVIVQASPKHVGEVAVFLRTEANIEILRTGPGRVLDSEGKDTSFYIRVI